jgi:prepilin-type N-terminal cleavage/methylation domain-containing protein
MVAHRRLRGFTLIELLVALAIFGLVVGVASYGFALFSRHWDGQSGEFERTLGQFQRLDVVVAALEDAVPWAVRDASGSAGFYFLGRDEGLTLVTDAPVFSPADAAVIRLFREREGADQWRLVYEEAPLQGVLLRHAGQTLPFAHRMVVLRSSAQPGFRYFGWGSLEERLAADDPVGDPGAPRWFDEYDGIERREHPQRIGLLLGESEAVFFVPARAQAALDRMIGTE